MHRILLVCALTAFAAACGRAEPAASVTPSSTAPASPSAVEPSDERVTRGNASFVLAPAIASSVESTDVPACPLDDPSDKPDGVAPQHIAFRFVAAGGSAPEPRPCSVPDFERAGIYVFSVEAFGKALPSAAAELKKLEGMFGAGALATGGRMPFVPFIDASFAVVERSRRIEFGGGQGILFLTELSIEPSTIGDQLRFVFQGLTRDAKWYVLGIFPATTTAAVPPFLADPRAPLDIMSTAYEDYLPKVSYVLSSAEDREFSPNPAALADMLATLRIE